MSSSSNSSARALLARQTGSQKRGRRDRLAQERVAGKVEGVARDPGVVERILVVALPHAQTQLQSPPAGDQLPKMFRLDAKEPMTLVDVREKEEFRAGYIPGAISMPRGFLEQQFEAKLPDKNAPIPFPRNPFRTKIIKPGSSPLKVMTRISEPRIALV